MKAIEDMHFGEYIEYLRKLRSIPMRRAAIAVGVSPQYYSEVEKCRRSTLTSERLEQLKHFLDLTTQETYTLYNKAAEARRTADVVLPQDFSDYIIQRDYTMAALRVCKELDANQADWQRFIDDLKRRKGEK